MHPATFAVTIGKIAVDPVGLFLGPIIDRNFRLVGHRCQHQSAARTGLADLKNALDGSDGHVFPLMRALK
jgi:hypothetical protein